MNQEEPETCSTTDELEPLLAEIRRRYAQLTDGKCERRIFLKRLRTLGSFGIEPVDYVVPETAELPKELEIAFAVCHPECGNEAFIILDGGPQGCDSCGGTMLPVKTAFFRRKKAGA